MATLDVFVRWPCLHVPKIRPGADRCFEMQPTNPAAWCDLCVETVAGAAFVVVREQVLAAFLEDVGE